MYFRHGLNEVGYLLVFDAIKDTGVNMALEHPY